MAQLDSWRLKQTCVDGKHDCESVGDRRFLVWDATDGDGGERGRDDGLLVVTRG